MRDSDRRYSSQQIETNLYEGEEAYDLPRNGLVSALVIGCIGGIIALAILVFIVLINAPLFNEAARLGDKMSYGVAISITTWQCSRVLIGAFIVFFVGIVTGKMTVKRWLGFSAGVLATGIAYLGNLLILYIPGYPDHLNSDISTSPTGIMLGMLAVIIPLAICTAIGGLISLMGARIATGRHPYYNSERKK